jgi:ankyrin repeat protein
VPPRGLPGNANLEQLRNGAKGFQRAVRAGDPGAAAIVNEFHPRLDSAAPGSPELDGFTRADAQLVVARQFGFASWPKLKAHLELVAGYARSPHREPVGGPLADEAAVVDEFLRLACLNYGDDDPERLRRAAALLDRHEWLATATVHTIAATGDVDAAGELLAADPAQASRVGGPHRWEPLLYLTYARVPLGEGAGADANDGQAIYNLAADGRPEWLELLLEFGLGRGDGGPWRRRFGERQDSPREMVEDLLMSSCSHGLNDRVSTLLAHGVNPDGRGSRHPIYQDRSPVQEAALNGHLEIVSELIGAGAVWEHDDVDELLAAATAGHRAEVDRVLASHPGVRERAIARRPDQLVRAAEQCGYAAVAILIDLGFDVNAMGRTAPLHEAAMRGDLAVIRLLLDRGADPTLRDTGYHATPAGWAEHHGQHDAHALLTALEQPDGE